MRYSMRSRLFDCCAGSGPEVMLCLAMLLEQNFGCNSCRATNITARHTRKAASWLSMVICAAWPQWQANVRVSTQRRITPSRPLNAVRRELDPTCSARAPEYETAGLCSPSGCPLKLNALPVDAIEARTHTNTPRSRSRLRSTGSAKGTPLPSTDVAPAPRTHLPRPSTTSSSQTRSRILRRRAKPRAKSLKPSRATAVLSEAASTMVWINGRRGLAARAVAQLRADARGESP